MGVRFASFHDFGTFPSSNDLLNNTDKGSAIAEDVSLRSLLLMPSGPVALPMSSPFNIFKTSSLVVWMCSSLFSVRNCIGANCWLNLNGG